MFVGEVIGFKDSGYTPHGEFVVAEIEVSKWLLGDESDTVLATQGGTIVLNYFGRFTISQTAGSTQRWVQVGDKLAAVAFPIKQDALYNNLAFIRFFTESPEDSLQPVFWTRKASFPGLRFLDPDTSPTLEEIYGLVDRTWEQDEMNLGELVEYIHHFYTERLRWRLTHRMPIWYKGRRVRWDDPDRGIVP